ncbi:MAG: alpha-glucosidase C-terminal domain-containing protein, partial [Pseudomonas sp.]|nr:alpha-glucosidase C-terminal domain-containing protein [Pseudomonas sp.]
KREAGVSHEDCMAAILQKSRDNSRTPMQWNQQANAGFSTAEPWIGIPENAAQINVEAQLNDSDSVLHHYRRLIALRREEPLLSLGEYRQLLAEHPQVWAYVRQGEGESVLVLNNFYGTECVVDLPDGVSSQDMAQRLLISNYDDQPTRTQRITLRPYESFAVHLTTQ